MQSAITEHQLTPAMAALVTRNGRRWSLFMYIGAGLWAAFFLGLGLWAVTKDDTSTLVFCIVGAPFGAAISIYLGRNFWVKAARDAASGRYLYYAGPVDIKVTDVDSDTIDKPHYYQLAFEGRLVSIDETTARGVKSSGGWVGVAFTPSGDFVFEVVDRQGQPLHRAAGYGPAPPPSYRGLL
jgi:hypothetical protein